MSGRLCVGVYGGAGQIACSIAEALSADHDVALLCSDTIDEEEASAASADLDLFVNAACHSTAINQAPLGWYYVSEPPLPPRGRDTLRHYVGAAGVRALGRPELPDRLEEVRAGFQRRVRRVEFIPTYQRYLASSDFTAAVVSERWNVPTDVVYPAVRPRGACGDKRPVVLNVGPFVDPRRGRSENQLRLVEAFDAANLTGWRLALAGNCDPADREYTLSVRRAALGRPVGVHVNARCDIVQRRRAEATISWHASGYGEDPRRHPERIDPFGVTVVEAMAAGAIPLVYGAGGQAEVVEHGVSGFHWLDLDELISLTRRLAADPDERRRIVTAGRDRAQHFSADRFATQLVSLLRVRP